MDSNLKVKPTWKKATYKLSFSAFYSIIRVYINLFNSQVIQVANFKTNVMRNLETNKIEYALYTYESNGDFDGCSVAEKIGKNPAQVFKTLVTTSPSKKYYVFVIPVVNELDLKACAAAVGEKSVEMIPVKDINKVTGYIRGGCSPIGMKKQYTTVIDVSCKDFETIVFSAGKIGYQVEISPQKLIDLVGATVSKIVR